MLSEFIVVAGLWAAGWLLVDLAGLQGSGRKPFSLLAGVAFYLIVGELIVLLGLPTHALWTWIISILIPVVLWKSQPRRKAHPGESSLHAWDFVKCLVLLFFVIAFVRILALEKYHIDTFEYMKNAFLFADNRLEFINLNHIEKRMFSFPIMLAAAHIYGQDYLTSLIPLLSLALLGVIAWFFREWSRTSEVDEPFRKLVLILSIALLVTNNRYVWNSFYLNGHLFVAICVTIIVAAGALLATQPERHQTFLVFIQVLMLPPLILTRPESFLFAALAILPFVLSESVPWRSRAAVLATYGITTTWWGCYIILAHAHFGKPWPVSGLGTLGIGVLALAALPLLRVEFLLRLRRPLLFATEGLLWLSLLALTIRQPEVLRTSLDATFQNIVLDEGSWGLSLVFLMLLTLLVLIFCRDRALTYLRFPVTTAIPLFFLLAYLREGAYRVGNGDSLNRMFIQIVPLAVLFLAMAALSRRWRRPFASREEVARHSTA